MHKKGACVLWCLLTSPSLCPCHLRIVCRASTVPLSNLSELRIWTLCWELGVLCAIVHPGRWIMWLTSPLKACQQTPFLSASLHQCMFGTYRRKATHVVAGWPLVSPHPANLWAGNSLRSCLNSRAWSVSRAQQMPALHAKVQA